MENFYVDERFLNSFQKVFEKNYVQDAPLGTAEVLNGCVLLRQKGSFKGIGVLDDQNVPVDFSKRYYPNDEFCVPSCPDEKDETVIYGGYLFEHWGHFLVESTCRLWYVLQNADDKTPVVFGAAREPSKVFLDFFELLGVADRIEFVYRPTRFKKVIVPEPAFLFCRQESISPLFLKPFDRIAERVTPAGYKKVYLSKSKWSGLDFQCFGEEKLERAFKENGYRIVYPEKMTLKEQVAVLKGAEEIATTAGTLAHNILFAPDLGDKRRTLIILNRAPLPLPVQACLNQLRNVRCLSVDAFYSPVETSFIKGPFFWHITGFVRKAFQDLNMTLPAAGEGKAPFERFVKAWGNVYWNKQGEAYTDLIGQIEDDESERATVSRLADCFKRKSLFKRQLFRLMYHLTKGKAKSAFKFLYKGASFVKTEENKAFLRRLKERRQTGAFGMTADKKT